MARLRFPGRPGYRFGRLGIKYGPDQNKGSVEFGLKLITNVQRGLRYFHELYGESEEVGNISDLVYFYNECFSYFLIK